MVCHAGFEGCHAHFTNTARPKNRATRYFSLIIWNGKHLPTVYNIFFKALNFKLTVIYYHTLQRNHSVTVLMQFNDGLEFKGVFNWVHNQVHTARNRYMLYARLGR